MAPVKANSVGDRIEQFISDVLDLIQQVRQDSRSAALGIGGAPAAAPRKRGRPRKVEVARPNVTTAPVQAEAPPPAAPRRVGRPRKVQPIPVAPAPEPEAAATEEPQAPGERETAVLETVKLLVRATAGEIARQSGLPNGSVYALLRSLAIRGQVAKMETSRGIEYGLVSAGGIRPFKRPRSSEPGPGSSPGAAGEPPPASEPPAEG